MGVRPSLSFHARTLDRHIIPLPRKWPHWNSVGAELGMRGDGFLTRVSLTSSVTSVRSGTQGFGVEFESYESCGRRICYSGENAWGAPSTKVGLHERLRALQAD